MSFKRFFKISLSVCSVFMTLAAVPVWGATAPAPAIVSAVVNTSTNQITITGSNFKPSTTAPTVTLDSVKLTLVSSAAATIVAKLPKTLTAGSYLLSVTNSASQAGTFNVTIGAVGPQGPAGATGKTGPSGAAATITVGTTTTGAAGTSASVTNSGTSSAAVLNFTIPRGAAGSAGSEIIYSASIFVKSFSSDDATGVAALTSGNLCFSNDPTDCSPGTYGYFTIVPAACSVKAIYAALTDDAQGDTKLSTVSFTLLKNSKATEFASCNVSSETPILCPQPQTAVAVSPGDTLSYQITFSGSDGGILHTTLLCQ